MIFILLDI